MQIWYGDVGRLSFKSTPAGVVSCYLPLDNGAPSFEEHSAQGVHMHGSSGSLWARHHAPALVRDVFDDNDQIWLFEHGCTWYMYA
jgi:hypothetical protein